MKKVNKKLILIHKYRTLTKVIKLNYQVFLLKARVILVRWQRRQAISKPTQALAHRLCPAKANLMHIFHD